MLITWHNPNDRQHDGRRQRKGRPKSCQTSHSLPDTCPTVVHSRMDPIVSMEVLLLLPHPSVAT
eukprot:6464268-Amphidinium_carterae.3